MRRAAPSRALAGRHHGATRTRQTVALVVLAVLVVPVPPGAAAARAMPEGREGELGLLWGWAANTLIIYSTIFFKVNLVLKLVAKKQMQDA